MLERVPVRGPILDVASGSAPLAARARDRDWVSVDSCPEELHVARKRGVGALVRADAHRLAHPDGVFPSATIAMALMVVPDPIAMLLEIARVLVREARIVVLVPTWLPATLRDAVLLARLSGPSRGSLAFPTVSAVVHPIRVLHHGGFAVEGDDTERFGYAIRSRRDAERFIDSLYHPGGDDATLARTVDYLTQRAYPVGLAFRRIVARPFGAGSG